MAGRGFVPVSDDVIARDKMILASPRKVYGQSKGKRSSNSKEI